jgi:hypothetical protein
MPGEPWPSAATLPKGFAMAEMQEDTANQFDGPFTPAFCAVFDRRLRLK